MQLSVLSAFHHSNKFITILYFVYLLLSACVIVKKIKGKEKMMETSACTRIQLTKNNKKNKHCNMRYHIRRRDSFRRS